MKYPLQLFSHLIIYTNIFASPPLYHFKGAKKNKYYILGTIFGPLLRTSGEGANLSKGGLIMIWYIRTCIVVYILNMYFDYEFFCDFVNLCFKYAFITIKWLFNSFLIRHGFLGYRCEYDFKFRVAWNDV